MMILDGIFEMIFDGISVVNGGDQTWLRVTSR